MPSSSVPAFDLIKQQHPIVTVKCAGQEFHLILAGMEPQIGSFEILDGVQCQYHFCKDQLILETECESAIELSGDTPTLRYLYVRTYGELRFALENINSDLHFRFDAASVKIASKISTNAAGAIFTGDSKDNKIVFTKDCFVNILLLQTTNLILNDARINATRTYVSAKKVISSGISRIIIGEKQLENIVDSFNIIPSSIALIFTNNSLVEIDEFSGTCNLDFCDGTFKAGALPKQSDLNFCRSVVLNDKATVREPNTTLILQDSIFHSPALEVSGRLDVLESDIFIDGKISFDMSGIVKLYGALICGKNVQIKCEVQYLEKNPNNPFDKVTPDSRIISSNEKFEQPAENNSEEQVITINHQTTKHTSHKQLRDFIKSKTYSTNEPHLRILQVPGDGNCALYSFVVNLLYSGMCYEERQKIIDVLSGIYNKYRVEVTSLQLYSNLEQAQFDAFAQEYLQANYNGYICEFFNKYFDMHAESYSLISFLAACSRLAILGHALPQIKQVHDPKNAHKRFTAEQKLSPHYPELLAAAEQESKTSLEKELSEFLPQKFMNIEYVQSYLASIEVNSTIKHQSGQPPLVCGNAKNKLAVTFFVTGNNDLNRHYEPELDLQITHGIKFGASINQTRDVNSNILLEMMAIMCYYVPKSINAFRSEYATKIQGQIHEIFEAKQQIDDDGSLVIHEVAKVTGSNGHLYATGALLVQDKVFINNCTVMSKIIEVSKTGVLDGGKNLKLQAISIIKNHGKILADQTQIIADYTIATNAAYIYGRHRLDIQTLIHVLCFSYLYTTSGNISAVAHINTGLMHVWNCPADSIINIDGPIIPCLPQRVSDLCDRQKLFTLFKMGLGVLSAEAALVLQVGSRVYSLSQTTKQIFALYTQLKDKNWREFSRHDTAALLMQIKRTANEGYGAYRLVPSPVQNISTATANNDAALQAEKLLKNFGVTPLASQMSQLNNIPTLAAKMKAEPLAEKVIENIKSKGIQTWRPAKTKDTFSVLHEVAYAQYTNANQAIQDSKATLKQAWIEQNELREKLSKDGKLLPSKDELRTNRALKTAIDAAMDVATVILPYKHIDTVLDVRYGFNGMFSDTSQSFCGLDGPLYSLSAYESKQRLFSQYNSRYSKHLAYDYNIACGLDYINDGTVDAINWNISARDYIERGTTDALHKIFDIKRDIHVTRDGGLTGFGEISGAIGGSFTIDGRAQLGAGRLTIGEKIDFTSTSNVTTSDLALFAKEFSYQGKLNLENTLYINVSHISSTPSSSISSSPEATVIIESITEALHGGTGQLGQIFGYIKLMDAQRARDFVYGLGVFSAISVAKSIKITTESTKNVMFVGLPNDGVIRELVTQGGITLDPNVYTRAKEDVFASYNEAASVAANYASYKIPPPPPPSKKKRFWRKVFKEVVKVVEAIGSVVGAASTPETMIAGAAIGGVASGIDQVIKHGERKENKKIEAGNKLVIEGQNIINRAILATRQQSANLALAEEQAYQKVQGLASGVRRNDAEIADANQRLLENQEQMNLEFASQFTSLEQAHEQNLYDLRVQNDAIRNQISTTGGPKVGFGAAVNTGSTGTSINLTTTIGNQNPVTNRLEIYSFDNSNSNVRNRHQHTEPVKPPRESLPPICDMPSQEPRETPKSQTQVFMIDEVGNELKLEPIEDSRTMIFSSDLKTSVLKSRMPVLEDIVSDTPASTESNHNYFGHNKREYYDWSDSDGYLEENIRNSINTFVSNPVNRIPSRSYNNYQEQTTSRVLWNAVTGDINAKLEMRHRWPNGAQFFDHYDPYLTRSVNDGAFMAEAKMYGRAALNIRDGFVHLLRHPEEIVTTPFMFGADVIEGALHYYGDMPYDEPARQRNHARIDSIVKLWNADGLAQREAMLTGIGSALLFGGMGRRTAPVHRDFGAVSFGKFLRGGKPISKVAYDTYAQGNVAKTNRLLTPVYENQQNILKAIKIENGGILASQSEIINEVGTLMMDDPVAYFSYKRLQSQGTKVIFDFDPTLSASNVRGVYDRIGNTVKINVRANKNSREVVSTIAHEAHHQKTHFNRNVTDVNTIYEEYQAFRREFLMEQGRRPNLNEKNKIWDWVYNKYSIESGYKDFHGNIKLGFSKDRVPEFVRSKLPSKGVSYSE